VYQISRQSDNPFPLYGNFHTFTKEEKKGKKTKETKPILKVHISKTPGAIQLKFNVGY